MVVVGLIGLLTLFAVPAFQGVGRMAAMRSAVNELRATISLARQYAITRRTDVYIVFPEDDDNNVADDGARKAYNVYFLDKDDQPVYMGDWKYLPTGVGFDTTSGGRNNVFDKNPTPNGMRGLGFKPTGVLTPQTHHEVFVTEGVVDGGIFVPDPSEARITFSLYISPFTGQVRIKEIE